MSAAMLAAKESGVLDPRSKLAQMAKPVTVLSHGIGMTSTDLDTRHQWNSIIVNANQEIPAMGESVFVTIDGCRAYLITRIR